MFVGIKCTQDLLHQLTAVQAVMRCPSKSHAIRRLIEDAYEKFFADKLNTVSNNPNQENRHETDH